MQARADHRSFIEDAPYALLLREQPRVEPRDLFEVRTCADEQQPEHHDAIEGVHIGHVRKLGSHNPRSMLVLQIRCPL